MGNSLEEEAQRLKGMYPQRYHGTIEHNLKWVSEEMALKPGSVSISEGLIAMSTDLPSVTAGGTKLGRAYKRGGSK